MKKILITVAVPLLPGARFVSVAVNCLDGRKMLRESYNSGGWAAYSETGSHNGDCPGSLSQAIQWER